MIVDTADKRVIVTAGANGIGRVIAERFQAQGARVFICDIDEAAIEGIKQITPEIGAFKADASDEQDVGRFFDKALRALGGLDILVNNAGIAGPTKLVEEISVTEWRKTLTVNLDSMFLATRLAVPELKRAGKGAIVNMSSVAGRLGVPLRSPYVTSKFGVVGFTQTLAMELGPHNISVNAILPGAIEGPRLDRVISERAKALGRSYEEGRRDFVSRISMRTMIDAEEIADMAIYLSCGPGRRISGQSISVCGNVESFGGEV